MTQKRDTLRAMNMLALGAIASEKPSLPAPEAEDSEDVVQPGETKSLVPRRMQETADNVHRKSRKWTLSEGIQGLGMARKMSGGEYLDEFAIRVYVDQKKPRKDCDAKIPKTIRVQGINQPVKTDVVEIGRLERQSSTGRLKNPAPGCSIYHATSQPSEAGTLGCLVRKIGNNTDLFLLSNAHIIANDGLARRGESIVQQGTRDGGAAPADTIASVWQRTSFKFINPDGTNGINVIDAAIGKVGKKRKLRSQILDGVGLPTGVSNRLVEGQTTVKKVGRTTGLRNGTVLDVNFSTVNTNSPMPYKRPGGGTGLCHFRDQVLCTKFSEGGDSGSVVLNNGNKIVGLIFSGSPQATLFNKITTITTAFNIEVVTVPIT